MTFEILTFGLKGAAAFPVTAETVIRNGLPYYDVIGHGSESVKESRKRIRSAILGSGFEFPKGHVIQNLAPGDVKKNGTLFDLPLALSLVFETRCRSAAAGEVSCHRSRAVIGELTLDGGVLPVRGTLPCMVCGKKMGVRQFIVPEGNYRHAIICPDIFVYPVSTLKDAAKAYVLDDEAFEDACRKTMQSFTSRDESGLSLRSDRLNDKAMIPDLEDIIGQEGAKRALLVAACGNHNILLSGSPGCGKTMLATALRGLLPEMSFEEYFDVLTLYDSFGLGDIIGDSKERPFRVVHRGITAHALTGGGRPVEIGEISLSHNGVLFLDEISEMQRNTIELLRMPLEEKTVYINNCGTKEILPADFMLVAASNPCPCGNLYEKPGACTCSSSAIKAYRARLSGAVRDRIDIKVRLRSVESDELTRGRGKTSDEIRDIVKRVRDRQLLRYKDHPFRTNSALPRADLFECCRLTDNSIKILKSAVEKFGLSVRGCEKTVKVARTIADIEEHEHITDDDILESLQYRVSYDDTEAFA